MKSATFERHTLSIRVGNEAGVLPRIVGLFPAPGDHIKSINFAGRRVARP